MIDLRYGKEKSHFKSTYIACIFLIEHRYIIQKRISSKCKVFLYNKNGFQDYRGNEEIIAEFRFFGYWWRVNSEFVKLTS